VERRRKTTPPKALAKLREPERAALAEFVATLRKKYPRKIARVILFGSRARGEGTVESDLDVAVVLKNGEPRLAEQVAHEANAPGFKHNLVIAARTWTNDAWNTIRRQREPIYRSVMSEGVELWSKRPHRVSRGIPQVYRLPRRNFRMDKNTKLMIRIRVERSLDDLDTARQLLGLQKFPAAVSRAYYAVFALTTAVLLTLDLVRAKHSGVESAFSEYFIREKRIENEYKDIFVRARKEREDADYECKAYTASAAQHIVADCERFVARMQTYLRQVGAIE
jgi:uncharacterized protein (UPF0332 family)/predicted nucleotidyltransferase